MEQDNSYYVFSDAKYSYQSIVEVYKCIFNKSISITKRNIRKVTIAIRRKIQELYQIYKVYRKFNPLYVDKQSKDPQLYDLLDILTAYKIKFSKKLLLFEIDEYTMRFFMSQHSIYPTIFKFNFLIRLRYYPIRTMEFFYQSPRSYPLISPQKIKFILKALVLFRRDEGKISGNFNFKRISLMQMMQMQFNFPELWQEFNIIFKDFLHISKLEEFE